MFESSTALYKNLLIGNLFKQWGEGQSGNLISVCLAVFVKVNYRPALTWFDRLSANSQGAASEHRLNICRANASHRVTAHVLIADNERSPPYRR